MTPRENLLRVLAFDHPEYVPTYPPYYGIHYLGANHESIDGTGGDNSPVGTHWMDIWGVGWHKELPDVMGLTESYPLADITKVDQYRCPDPYDPRICDTIHAASLDFDRNQLFLVGSHRNLIFEQAYKLVGMEALFIAFYEEPEAVKTLLHRIIDFHLGIAQQYIARGVEWASMSEDLGHQSGLFFSRDILDEFFVPEYRRLFDYYQQHEVKINFHSCGRIQDIVDIFIDLGINILNPVQATANDLKLLRARTQGRLTLQGAIPSHIVSTGPITRIRAEVREKISLLGKDGGYICSPDQGMPTPAAHIVALEEAIQEYGQYPISISMAEDS